VNKQISIITKRFISKLSCALLVTLILLLAFSQESQAAKPSKTVDPIIALDAKALSQTQVDLSWNYSDTSSITGYSIERSQNPTSGFQAIATADSLATAFGDAPLSSGKSYYYRMRAFKKAGKNVSYSSYSAVASATTPVETDTTAPTVSISSPAAGSNYTSAQTVAITVAAQDNVGVSKIELYDGATLRGTDSTAPYSFSWAITSADNGSHSLTAKAYDAAGNVMVSSAANLSVNIVSGTPGSFEFSSSAYAVGEGAGKVDITIKRVGGSAGAVTVDWRTNAVTATYDVDYGSFNWTTLTFADGETQKVKSIAILDDSLVEGDETFRVSLSNPTEGASLGNVTSTVVTIKDNDNTPSDTTAPTVSISSPTAGTTLTSAQTVAITVAAQDNVGVSKVELYDGGTLRGTDSTAPYSFSWAITSADNGSHSFTAKAYDAAGNSKVSSSVSLTVNVASADTSAPTVSITSPTTGKVYSSAQTVSIAVAAQDNIGVSKVELYDGVTLVGTDASSPYSFSWAVTSADNGSHVFTAKAYDAAGNSKVSSTVGLTVDIATDPAPSGPLKVFPGAQGFGTETPAGRGGKIIKVTNLNDSGTGSLRAAIQASGARIIVFEVSGTIQLQSNLSITNPYVTIAGQTAPSPGITLRGATMQVRTHDVLVQHLRVRVGDNQVVQNPDATWVYDSAYNVVIDHNSFSWAIDENMSCSLPGTRDITFSNNFVTEGLSNSVNTKGEHSKGSLMYDDIKDVALIGNLFAHNKERNPQISSNNRTLLVNNLNYNPGNYKGGIYFTIGNQHGPSYSSVIGNVGIPGPDTDSGWKMIYIYPGVQDGQQVYVSDNLGPNYSSSNSWAVVNNQAGSRVVASTPPVMTSPLTIRPSSTVEGWVLQSSGARPADRDSVDERIVNEVRSRTGNIIDSQNQVGGWPVLAQNYRTFNAGSNPNGDDDGDGYTNIEEILHQMAAQVEGR